jgi:hypothetical protein
MISTMLFTIWIAASYEAGDSGSSVKIRSTGKKARVLIKVKHPRPEKHAVAIISSKHAMDHGAVPSMHVFAVPAGAQAPSPQQAE